MTRRTVGAVLSVAVSLVLTGPVAAAEPVPLEQAVSDAMLAAKTDDVVAAYGAWTSRAALVPLVEPKRSARDWVFGGSVFPIPDGVHAAPVTSLFLAERDPAGSWDVALEGSAEFARLAREAPDALFVDAGERAALAATPPPAAAHAGQHTGLALPWRKGQGGWLHSGVHGTLTPNPPMIKNAIDFYGGDGLVRASAGGYLYRFCTTVNPYIQIRHPNGLTTGYYHQRELTDVPDGAWVDAYHVIGVIAEELPCGGATNRPHVHLALLRDGQPVPVDGLTIGGWTWHEDPNANYAGHAERNRRQVHEHECCLKNYGAHP